LAKINGTICPPTANRNNNAKYDYANAMKQGLHIRPTVDIDINHAIKYSFAQGVSSSNKVIPPNAILVY